ncbi:MAG: VWA domain-containing protein [Flaviflexus sp.]|uniref:VWA domain-containing protein n=1 Tax=Flaviflexus sp. TaxID=1969482 RepID=UPI00352ECD1F
MTFEHAWPVWATLLVAVLFGTLCVLGWRRSKDTPTWIRRALMGLCVVLLGLTPASTIYTQEQISNAEYYFVIDLTGSMGAEDWNGESTRLEGAKADMRDIIEANPGAQYSIIAFSSTATSQLPLTTDSRAALSWLETARRESTLYSQGSSINRPADELEKALASSMERNPQNVRVVIMLTDGESTNHVESSRDDEPDYGGLADYVDDGYVFGYGTEEGAPMRRSYGGEDETEYINDPQTGEPGISKIDEEALQLVAEQLDITYVHRTSPGGAGDLVSDIPVDMIAADGREERGIYNPMLWPIGLALIVLIGWELWYFTPKLAALRRGV